MQKLRPYIIPGLFLFHLVLLCVMIFTGYDPNSVKDLLTDSPPYAASLLSQFLLTALWAGLGSGPPPVEDCQPADGQQRQGRWFGNDRQIISRIGTAGPFQVGLQPGFVETPLRDGLAIM